MVYRYPPEVHEFVKAHCREMSDTELAPACNEACGTAFTPRSIKAFRSNHGYKNGLPKSLSSEEWERRNYPPGTVDFIRENSWGVSSAEMAKKVNEKFGTHFTPGSMKQFRASHGIKSGVTGWFRKGREPGNKGKKLEEYLSPERAAEVRAKMAPTQFKTGNKSWNLLPVGSVVVSCIGYKMRKKQMGGPWNERWELYHRWVWEQHNGPVPDGFLVTFRDGDRMNCDISNLMLVTPQENHMMNTKRLRSSDPELTDAGLKVAKLILRTKELRKK